MFGLGEKRRGGIGSGANLGAAWSPLAPVSPVAAMEQQEAGLHGSNMDRLASASPGFGQVVAHAREQDLRPPPPPDPSIGLHGTNMDKLASASPGLGAGIARAREQDLAPPPPPDPSIGLHGTRLQTLAEASPGFGQALAHAQQQAMPATLPEQLPNQGFAAPMQHAPAVTPEALGFAQQLQQPTTPKPVVTPERFAGGMG